VVVLGSGYQQPASVELDLLKQFALWIAAKGCVQERQGVVGAVTQPVIQTLRRPVRPGVPDVAQLIHPCFYELLLRQHIHLHEVYIGLGVLSTILSKREGSRMNPMDAEKSFFWVCAVLPD
jgi:hypothetical protein